MSDVAFIVLMLKYQARRWSMGCELDRLFLVALIEWFLFRRRISVNSEKRGLSGVGSGGSTALSLER